MNALDVIRRDHRAAEELFEDFKKANEERRDQLAPRIFAALTAHELMEDKHFYPALDGVLDGNEAFEALEGEQLELKARTVAARAVSIVADRDEQIKSLMERVLIHAKMEEAEVFPEAEKALSAEKLQELGAQMEPDSAVAKDEG